MLRADVVEHRPAGCRLGAFMRRSPLYLLLFVVGVAGSGACTDLDAPTYCTLHGCETADSTAETSADALDSSSDVTDSLNDGDADDGCTEPATCSGPQR